MNNAETKSQTEFAPVEISNTSSFDGKPVDAVKAGTVISGYTVITKSMIGAGMFSMAYGCQNFGIIFGIFLLILAAAITWLSLRVLSLLALEYQASNPSFYSVSEKLIPKLKWLIDVALIINCFGGVVAYVQTFGGLLTKALVKNISWDQAVFSESATQIVVQAGILLCLAPLCLMKEISATKIANMVGLGCIAYIVVMTFFYMDYSAFNSAYLYPKGVLQAFGSFPTFIFAYACQQNIFGVANELKDVSMKKLNVVSSASVLTGFLIYLPLMIFPFISFGYDIESTYLANLTPATGSMPIPVMIAYIFASLSVSISYVLLLQPVRCSIMSLAFGKNQPTGRKELMIRSGIVAVLMCASFGLAVALGKSLSLPINLAGLLGGNTMCFVAPFILFLRQYGFNKRSYFCWAVVGTLGFCLALYPICLTGIIYDAINA